MVFPRNMLIPKVQFKQFINPQAKMLLMMILDVSKTPFNN